MQRETYPDAIRGAAILLVVAIHAFGYLRLPVEGAWNLVWICISSIAVPVFFMAEGWLHARRYTGPVGGAGVAAALRSAAPRLLLPWIAFSVIYLGFRLSLERGGVVTGPSVLPEGLSDVPKALLAGTAAGHLYFLPALLLVRAVSFGLHPLVRGRLWAASLAAATLVVVIRLWIRPVLLPDLDVEILNAALNGIGFAAIGWALAELEGRGHEARRALVGAIPLALAGLLVEGLPATLALSCAALMMAWAAARGCPPVAPYRWLTALGRRTMDVYLLHMPVPVSLGARAMLATNVPGPLALVALVALSAASALAVGALLRRFGLGWLGFPRRG